VRLGKEVTGGGAKTTLAKGAKFVITGKSSTRISDKNIRILDKAQAFKTKPF
jgi:hypothetical protein